MKSEENTINLIQTLTFRLSLTEWFKHEKGENFFSNDFSKIFDPPPQQAGGWGDGGVHAMSVIANNISSWKNNAIKMFNLSV